MAAHFLKRSSNFRGGGVSKPNYHIRLWQYPVQRNRLQLCHLNRRQMSQTSLRLAQPWTPTSLLQFFSPLTSWPGVALHCTQPVPALSGSHLRHRLQIIAVADEISPWRQWPFALWGTEEGWVRGPSREHTQQAGDCSSWGDIDSRTLWEKAIPPTGEDGSLIWGNHTEPTAGGFVQTTVGLIWVSALTYLNGPGHPSSQSSTTGKQLLQVGGSQWKSGQSL